MKDDQASSTAYTVLQGIMYTAKYSPYKHLVSEDVVKVGKQILQGSEEGRKRLQQLDSVLLRLSVKLKEFLLVPGITLHYVLRKNHVERIARQSISEGVTQVVMLGAGFDTLSWRLHQQHPEVNFIEIDHPATQREKQQALEQNEKPGPNMFFLSVDFSRQDLQTALSEFDHFEPQRPTLFICEGVMMYLSEQDVAILFASIKQLTGPGTRFLYTALEPMGSPKNTIPKMLYTYLSKLGEPINWDLDSPKMPDFVKQHHCEFIHYAGRDELVEQYVKDELQIKLHSCEYFTYCRFSN